MGGGGCFEGAWSDFLRMEFLLRDASSLNKSWFQISVESVTCFFWTHEVIMSPGVVTFLDCVRMIVPNFAKKGFFFKTMFENIKCTRYLKKSGLLCVLEI